MRLRLLAIEALRFGLAALFACLLLLVLLLLLALLERGLWAERLVLLALPFSACGRTRPGRRLEALYVQARRRHVAVAHSSVLVDPLVLLRRGRGGEETSHNKNDRFVHDGETQVGSDG
jgi:hypothetical protein